MYDLLIRDGTVITASQKTEADVAVKDGKIAALMAPGAKAEARETVSAGGMYILPGAIDLHTHLALPFGGTTSTDDYESGTRSALCGGTTMVFDYATPEDPEEPLVDFLERRQAMADAQVCSDYAFHLVLNHPGEKVLSELPQVMEKGVTSFKVYTVYDGMMVDDGFFFRLLEKSKELGGLVCVHAENKDMIDLYVERYKQEGKLSPWYHYMSRREFIEAEADIRCIHWAKELDAPLYIVHLANKEGVEALEAARNQGYDILAETNPLYLRYNCQIYRQENGRNYVCSPPIKGEESRQKLWQALKAGSIDTVATDHCPFLQAEKDWGLHDFTKIPNGCDGVETRYPYLLSEANKGNIFFEKVVETCCTNPARIFGCAPQKGTVAVGSDADLVIYDPAKEVTVTNDILHSKIDHTVWEGTKLTGYPVQTYVRGGLVYRDGQFLGSAGSGRFIKRAPYRKA
jgi:dihydropyrimidinase